MKIYLLLVTFLLSACVPTQAETVSETPPTPVIVYVVITTTPAPTTTSPTSAPPEKPFRFTAQYAAGNGDGQTGFSLPPYGTLCEDTPVYGGPDPAIYEPLYVLLAGDVVQLREQPLIEHRDWIMIKTAQWIPLSAVCE